MKILTFYSYKGGQGRTTAMSNLGACLYRMGYNVVLLDLDIESPGLPAKFNRSVFEDPEIQVKGGVIDFLLDSYGRMNPIESIEDRSLTIAPNNQHSSKVYLKLIPTGFVDKGKLYFESSASTGWKYLSHLSPGGPNKMRFFGGLVAAIKRMTPKPDYLLVDLSSGNTAFGRVGLITMADTVFCFFGPDPENIDGMKYVLRDLQEVPHIRKSLGLRSKPLNIIPSLCRIPPFLHKDDLLKIRQRASERLYGDKDTPIFLLHSDADLEHEWHLLIPLEGKVHNVQLTRDYLNLLLGAWPYIKIHKKDNVSLNDLINILGLTEDINEQYRVFRLEHTQGVMINLSDSERNVSFKVKTFCAMLNDIHEGILSKVQPRQDIDEKTFNKVKQVTEKEFYNAGLAPGANFGQSLIEEVWPNQDGMNDLEKLEEWCKFDSSVGFGNMSSVAPVLDVHGRAIRGMIVVGHNFLAEDRGVGEADLCKLFTGYISGVLEKILKSKVRVRHPKELCMRINHDRISCDFPFQVESRKKSRTRSRSRK